MIYIPDELSAKIKLLQDSLGSMSIDEVKELVKSDLVVAKLKGVSDATDILLQVQSEFARLQNELDVLKTIPSYDTLTLREDFKTLLRCLNKGFGDPNAFSDFNALKSKHGIY